ncbi:MAG TPA: hypothetical protein DCQ64_18545 [Candidatus Rokubacteria bacterium]|nr:hypothetical protein [Candidatus Rokubacteria bacterium]
MPDANPLELVPLDDLVGELFRRSDVAVLALLVDLGGQQTQERRMTKGHMRVAQGLAFGLMVECETTIRQSSREGCDA